MGYRTDQFYRIERAEPFTGGFIGGPGGGASDTVSAVPPSNPDFIYPDKTIRTANGVTKELKRGYIRSLLNEVDGKAVRLKKCQFQFNPQVLEQSVSMNTSILNFFQQDPAQLSRPLASEVNFSFTALFDRSMELNNPKGLGNETDLDYPWEKGDPSEVGVLRDIATLYATIGQSISKDQVDFAKSFYAREAFIDDTVGDTSSEDGEESAVYAADDINANIEEVVNINAGNTALLLPLPVRIVFSSLYVVEGYVTNTTIAYTKFNSAMVPMQATVSISLNAMYIGFAKKDTFTTWSIQKAKEAAEERRSEALANTRDSIRAITSELSTIKAKFHDPPQWSNTVVSPAVGLILTGNVPDTKYSSVVTNIRENGPVQTLLEEAAGVRINITGDVRVWGPFDSSSHLKSDGTPTRFFSQSPNLSWSMATARGLGVDEWIKMTKDPTYLRSTAKNGGNWFVSGINGKWFGVKIMYRVTLEIEGKSVVGTGSYGLKTQEGDGAWSDEFSFPVTIKWEVAGGDDLGLLTPVSDADTVNEPGTVSNVSGPRSTPTGRGGVLE